MGQLLPILSNYLVSIVDQYDSADEWDERIIRVAFIQILQIPYHEQSR